MYFNRRGWLVRACKTMPRANKTGRQPTMSSLWMLSARECRCFFSLRFCNFYSRQKNDSSTIKDFDLVNQHGRRPSLSGPDRGPGTRPQDHIVFFSAGAGLVCGGRYMTPMGNGGQQTAAGGKQLSIRSFQTTDGGRDWLNG